ncbi:uncharacterized protein B0T15DRAFT_526689 [Chaetomium strumarium]|uniref:2EXR domain-containing protein n=1 Tax=Chaetomium strumarium TaxID=1170767 RepID=A0AAJ0GZW8_9PEZI|nr:hypothetical protein B0T15DRAFT_526689 [Chaetomium strumarium]
MAADHQFKTTASQFAHFCLDPDVAEPGPNDTPALKIAGVGVPPTPFGPSVTVTELPSPPASPSPTQTAVMIETALEEPASPTRAAPGTFPYFPLLPAELRLKIWHMSFLPRTVELHTRRAHYADDENLRLRSATPKWQSLSKNPAALSVNAEARAAALEHYTVALPLFAPPSKAQNERPGDLLQISDRVLYLNLEQDTVVLLGDLHYTRLTRLLDWFRKMDNKPTRGQQRRRDADDATTSPSTRGKGLRRLAMSVALWAHEVGAATLKAFARTVFADIEEFVLFMYSERLPPPTWGGGLCLLEEAAADADYYRRFLIGRGRQFRVGNDWMVVGQRPMKVADICFEEGW